MCKKIPFWLKLGLIFALVLTFFVYISSASKTSIEDMNPLALLLFVVPTFLLGYFLKLFHLQEVTNIIMNNLFGEHSSIPIFILLFSIYFLIGSILGLIIQLIKSKIKKA